MYQILYNPAGIPIVVAKDKIVPKAVIKYLARIGATTYFVTSNVEEEGDKCELPN